MCIRDRVPPSQFFFYLVVAVIVLATFSWTYFGISSQQDNLVKINNRLITLEENVQSTSDSSEENIETLLADLKIINREIRKLWDLSNKRNRRNIETTMKSLETLQEQSDNMVKKSQLNEESLKRLALSLDKTRKLVARISGADNSFDQLESKITEIEEANRSNMAFREQISEALIRIQADLSSLEIALEDK